MDIGNRNGIWNIVKTWTAKSVKLMTSKQLLQINILLLRKPFSSGNCWQFSPIWSARSIASIFPLLQGRLVGKSHCFSFPVIHLPTMLFLHKLLCPQRRAKLSHQHHTMIFSFLVNFLKILWRNSKMSKGRGCLVTPWLKIHLPMRKTWVWSPVGKIPYAVEQVSPCAKATEPGL